VAVVDESERARLIEEHIDIPVRAAKMIYPRVREHLQFDELVSLGNQGLAESASRYDPTKGASFKTFAWYRVQGAIIDGIRRMTVLPRRVWHRLVALRAAADYLENRGERDAGARAQGTPEADGAEALAKIKQSIAAIRTMYMTSLEAHTEKTGFDPAAHEEDSPDKQIDLRRISSKLADAIAKLPERERKLLELHYYDGLNLLEAGEKMGISKSWASRMHGQAVDRLRKIINPDE